MTSKRPDNVSAVARVYAQALLEMADEAHQVNEIGEELVQLGQLLSDHNELLALLANRLISTDERSDSLEKIFKGRVSDLVYRFLLVVNRKDRLGELPGVIAGYAQLLDERNNIIEGDVYVAERLSDSQSQDVSDAVSRVVGMNVVLSQQVDPGVIGGFKVRVGDRLIDGSVTTQLSAMRSRLTAIGRDKARQAATESGQEN